MPRNATLFALVAMLLYIAFRFEFVYGVGATVAVIHDVVLTLALVSLFNLEITLYVIAAFLTLVGYSVNDTIVIFDRVRENRKLVRRSSLEEIINLSINQTLRRTVLTSGLTLFVVIALYVMGGAVLSLETVLFRASDAERHHRHVFVDRDRLTDRAVVAHAEKRPEPNPHQSVSPAVQVFRLRKVCVTA